MGLFSKKITTVGTTVTRIIEDKDIPNAVKNAVVKSNAERSDQLVEYILEGLVDSLALRADRMYEYGKKKYSYGLPEGHVVTSTDGQELVEFILEDEIGSDIKIDYYHFGSLNLMHLGWSTLFKDHNYNPATNEISALSIVKGFPVYLKNMVPVVTDATLEELGNGSLDQWGVSPAGGFTPEQKLMSTATGTLVSEKPFVVDPSATEDYVRVYYVWEVEETVQVEGVPIKRKVIKEESFDITTNKFKEDSEWYHVKYSINNSIGYWIYQAASGDYPALDTAYEKVNTGLGSYYPITYLRFDKKSMDEKKGTDEYKTSKKMLDYLNLDYPSLITSIHENPDIGDVEQAMVMLAVPAVTDNPKEQRYLFDYFNQLYLANALDQDKQSEVAWEVGDQLAMTKPDAGIIIQDDKFKMAVNYRNIVKNKIVGKIGKVGTYDSGYGITTVSKPGVVQSTGQSFNWDSDVEKHYYQHQISEDMYEEISVYNLKMTYYIYQQYTTTGDETDKILMIPLDRAITRLYSIPHREELIARSMHFVFNSRIVTKLKWYQTSVFRFIMIIIMIIVTIFTYGSTWQGLAAAVAAGTITATALIYIVAMGILKYLAVMLAVKLFVKAVGAEAAFIIAIIAAAAGSYQAVTYGSIAGAPYASQLLQVSTALSKGVENQTKDDFTDLLDDQKTFGEFVDAETKRLEEANALLEGSTLATPLIIFGETPNEYYQRTVHSGNIGAVGIDAISSYVEYALQLPKLNTTVGDLLNG